MIATGVRWEESLQRNNERGIYERFASNKSNRIILNSDNDDRRQLFENCRLKAKRVCNPIIDWKTEDVWRFLWAYKVETNPLYQCGFNRVGCVGCPKSGDKRYFEFNIFPQYEQMYRRAFCRMIEARTAKGKTSEGSWATGDGVFKWWIEDKNLDGQLSWF